MDLGGPNLGKSMEYSTKWQFVIPRQFNNYPKACQARQVWVGQVMSQRGGRKGEQERLGDLGGDLIGRDALKACGINGSANVVVGLTSGHGSIGVT